MKKNLAIIAALAALTMVSCQMELVDVVNEPEQEVVLTEIGATAQEIDTKAYVDGLQIKWNSGDRVAVANEDDEVVSFTLSSGENTASAVFSADLGGKALGNYAVYPDSPSAMFVGNDAAVDYLDNWEYGKSEVPMYGIKGASDVYTFHIIGGAVQVSYSNIPATTNNKKIVLTETHTGGAAKCITGPVFLYGLDSTPTIDYDSLNGQEVTITDIPKNTTNVTLVIPVPEGSGYDFMVELYEEGASDPIAGSVKSATNKTVTAGKILRFPNISLPQMLFHETFGNNTGSARAWSDSYSVKSGVSSVYSGITAYTVSNAKQGKNTTGSTQSGLNQSTQGTDAYIIIGPLNVASATDLVLTYQWKAASIKGTYTTSLSYATSSGGVYTNVSGTGAGATTFVERKYNLPAAAQVSTLYLKIVWNTSNTQGIIDEVNLQGVI